MRLDRNLKESDIAGAMDNDIFFVAQDEDKLVGFIQFGEPDIVATDNSQELHRIYVDKDYQGQGTGRLLMDVALRHPRLLRAPQIFLVVWEHNLKARKFYGRYGFDVTDNLELVAVSGVDPDVHLAMVRHRRKP
jgi:ribosomal protein S18 acetylase RimI-like enzyme